MIPPELLEILACPVCHASLEVKQGDAGLKCRQCHRLYPLKDGIPVLLKEEAVVEPS
ncbi:MAG TPA: Trm112 family protein [Terriglobales bacterium]|nr:Trm112 family protein [Terriglobales bacterium]